MSDIDVPEEFDWGGDGSDLSRPIAEHVRAALVLSDGAYPPPLDQLLRLGSPHSYPTFEAATDPIAFTDAHIPDLVRLARDRALNTQLDDAPEIWAPIHAVLALKRLDVGSYAADLVPLFDIDSEWFGEELPAILGRAGAPSVEPLRQYLQDPARYMYGRWNAAGALTSVAQQHPDLRGQVIDILSGALADPRSDPETNGFLLSSLIKLEATEALPAIRAAFERDAIDESIAGSLGEALSALKQPIDQNDPLIQRSHARRQAQIAHNRALLPNFGSRSAEVRPATAAAKAPKAGKRKNKRKMSSASRKANQKKRR